VVLGRAVVEGGAVVGADGAAGRQPPVGVEEEGTGVEDARGRRR
jgi:hypothetical protein